jgi:hypothetical protein
VARRSRRYYAKVRSKKKPGHLGTLAFAVPGGGCGEPFSPSTQATSLDILRRPLRFVLIARDGRANYDLEVAQDARGLEIADRIRPRDRAW